MAGSRRKVDKLSILRGFVIAAVLIVSCRYNDNPPSISMFEAISYRAESVPLNVNNMRVVGEGNTADLLAILGIMERVNGISNAVRQIVFYLEGDLRIAFVTIAPFDVFRFEMRSESWTLVEKPSASPHPFDGDIPWETEKHGVNPQITN